MRLTRVLPEGLIKEKLSDGISEILSEESVCFTVIFAIFLSDSASSFTTEDETFGTDFSTQPDNIKTIVHNAINFFIINYLHREIIPY